MQNNNFQLKIFRKREYLILGLVMITMLVYFLLATPVMMDDGFHYQSFAESAARGKIDFKSFYGFQGLSFLAVPVFWLTGSAVAIMITSVILFLLALPLAFLAGREYYQSSTAGLVFLALVLLMPYPYVTLWRGFQEAALLFFVLLIIYGSLKNKNWTPLAWATGGLVKPFALVLAPLWFSQDWLRGRKLIWLTVALTVGGLYLGASYYQTGHLVNNAAINSYQGNFNTGQPPPLNESFTLGGKGFFRIGANLLIHSRKILISPLVILLGALAWWKKKKQLRRRKEMTLAIIFNVLLVGLLTFSFPKYLLPLTILLALWAVPYLEKYWWLAIAVLVDSWFVFGPIYAYFGHNFWSNQVLYLTPWILAGLVFAFAVKDNKKLRLIATGDGE